jgi:hypothetical protein
MTDGDEINPARATQRDRLRRVSGDQRMVAPSAPLRSMRPHPVTSTDSCSPTAILVEPRFTG